MAPTPPNLLIKPEMMPELLGSRRLTGQSINAAKLHISSITENKLEDSCEQQWDPALDMRKMTNS